MPLIVGHINARKEAEQAIWMHANWLPAIDTASMYHNETELGNAIETAVLRERYLLPQK